MLDHIVGAQSTAQPWRADPLTGERNGSTHAMVEKAQFLKYCDTWHTPHTHTNRNVEPPPQPPAPPPPPPPNASEVKTTQGAQACLPFSMHVGRCARMRVWRLNQYKWLYTFNSLSLSRFNPRVCATCSALGSSLLDHYAPSFADCCHG